MPKPKGECNVIVGVLRCLLDVLSHVFCAGKGGKNRRRGKGDGEESKREIEFKEDGKLSAHG
jgi:hypothetical protein